jgi:hypothetical protein
LTDAAAGAHAAVAASDPITEHRHHGRSSVV